MQASIGIGRRSVRFVALLAVVPVFVSAAGAQTAQEWSAFYDGPTGYTDFGRFAAVDAAGGRYVAGQQFNQLTGFPPPPPMADFAVVKLTPAGATAWTTSVDPLGGMDGVLDLAIAPAGEVYTAGYASSTGGGYPVLIQLAASNGAFQWQYVHPLPGFGRQIGFDAAGGPHLVGHAYAAAGGDDLLVVKTTPAGAFVWERQLDGGSNANDNGYAILVLPSGEVLVAGALAVTGDQDFAVVKLDAAGNVAWTATADGGSNGTDAATHLAVDGGKVVAAGWRAGPSGNDDWMIAQIDLATGAFDWTRFHGGPGSGIERARSLVIDPVGMRWIAGSSSSVAGGIDFGVALYDVLGNLHTSSTWNNAGADRDDQPMKLLRGSAGQTWLVGYSYRNQSAPFDVDVQVVQYGPGGQLDWARNHSVGAGSDDRIFEAELAPGNKLFVAGMTDGSGSGSTDFLGMSIDLNDAPQAYCTAKVNSLGCSPSLSFLGNPSASSPDGFTVFCTQARNRKNGLLFYGLSGPAAVPFKGGWMCVQAPIARTPVSSSGGSALPIDDCSGLFLIDMNAFAASGAGQPGLSIPGTAVCCEQWSRDPASSFQSSLSNALRYVVLP